MLKTYSLAVFKVNFQTNKVVAHQTHYYDGSSNKGLKPGVFIVFAEIPWQLQL